jgi:glutamate 5-kinase
VSGLALADFRRLVIKVGSSLLVDDTGQLNRAWLEKLADDVAALAAERHEILIVSSGAVARHYVATTLSRRRYC